MRDLEKCKVRERLLRIDEPMISIFHVYYVADILRANLFVDILLRNTKAKEKRDSNGYFNPNHVSPLKSNRDFNSLRIHHHMVYGILR